MYFVFPQTLASSFEYLTLQRENNINSIEKDLPSQSNPKRTQYLLHYQNIMSNFGNEIIAGQCEVKGSQNEV